ncbi:hypothetical protein LB518_24085 [Mesorhizobium sp. BR1-1-16]|uniref:hypothetical protein n=1 Tax=Mesorhizobium sp. BR1-1-16 TaxID=2876653 RepID=UPI001CCE5B3E|nr:hypothetical protein [Mesorhizobium sp. BR1-1-16]MBZ9939389.1 hypothetical protein [Mesorhizobium sp. BR1-1-16]
MTLEGQIASTNGIKPVGKPVDWAVAVRSRGAGIGDRCIGIVRSSLTEERLARMAHEELTRVNTHQAGSAHRAAPSRDDIRDNQIWVGPPV